MKHNGEHHGNGSRRPDEILAEIERTRGEMDHTLTAIEQRLTPGQLIDQGLDYLKNSGGSEMVSNLGVQVKNNPLPLALVGVGLAWLMASSKNPPARQPEPAWPYASMDEESARSGLGNRAHETLGSAKQKLGDTTQAMRERVSSAGERVSQLGQSARDTVGNLGTTARQQMDRAKGGVDYMMREQPLALGALGVAIGALFAAMAPRTQKEDELMGSTRDRLLDQAKEVGKEKLEQAKDVAKTVTETATKEAEKKGLTSAPQQVKPEQPKPQGQQQPKPHVQAKPNVPQAKPAAAQSPTTTLPPVGGNSGPRRTS
jgi:hypothetical protein